MSAHEDCNRVSRLTIAAARDKITGETSSGDKKSHESGLKNEEDEVRGGIEELGEEETADIYSPYASIFRGQMLFPNPRDLKFSASHQPSARDRQQLHSFISCNRVSFGCSTPACVTKNS